MTAAALRQPRGRALRPIAGYRQTGTLSNTSHPGLGRDGSASRHAQAHSFKTKSICILDFVQLHGQKTSKNAIIEMLS